ncbi:hypothetical protein IAG44_33790 [Streptomyces roseirectus]|uniref:Uncharacterized protein n=1 Tax=Streptomyces roseirectus TaxID=2768066 RepID=A0A7H0IMC8_9ACTN|nr:hypothetical protein [Streptomyces roseirectus]QNP73944.1 hypothetical protein IAG44_33790 [Streptomyces roseirectus]
MGADIERLAAQVRDLHVAFDSGEWKPSPAEYACAVQILEAVATGPLSEAIVQGLGLVASGGGLAEESRFGPAAVTCAVCLRRSVDPNSLGGRQVRESFLDLLRKMTGGPGEGAAVVGRR